MEAGNKVEVVLIILLFEIIAPMLSAGIAGWLFGSSLVKAKPSVSKAKAFFRGLLISFIGSILAGLIIVALFAFGTAFSGEMSLAGNRLFFRCFGSSYYGVSNLWDLGRSFGYWTIRMDNYEK